MHIFIIPSWYKTPKNPITGTFFEEQARMLQKRGHRVGILFPKHELRFLGDSRFEGEPAPRAIEDNGIPTYYSFTQSIVPKVGYPTSVDLWTINTTAYKSYKSYVKKYGKPDVIHAHSAVYGGIVANYISKKENIPYFLTKHFTGWILLESRKRSKTFKKLLEGVVNKSSKTFVVSTFYRDQLLKDYRLNPMKLEVVHNVINPIFYENRIKILLSNPIKLSVIGYLVERKNHLTLFKALKILKDKGFQIELKVIGDGPFGVALKQFTKQNNLESEINFLGLLDREDVLKQAKESHIIVSASTFETFGVNIIEGMAIGRPVVVYNSGGPLDIVRPKDGILFNDNTPQAFANAIQNVINNYDSYDQMQIAEDCIVRFGEEHIYQKLIKYYKEE